MILIFGSIFCGINFQLINLFCYFVSLIILSENTPFKVLIKIYLRRNRIKIVNSRFSDYRQIFLPDCSLLINTIVLFTKKLTRLKNIEIYGKKFQLFIPNGKIMAVVEKMAEKMNNDLAGENPLFICILIGSFMFVADLFKRIKINSEITFLRVASYSGDRSAGTVKNIIDLNENIKGRTVVVVEDIVDSGLTINNVIERLKEKSPMRIITATLLLKPDALKEEVKLDYVGMEIPNDFIVGYGLDYNGLGRNLSDIYSLINE